MDTQSVMAIVSIILLTAAACVLALTADRYIPVPCGPRPKRERILKTIKPPAPGCDCDIVEVAWADWPDGYEEKYGKRVDYGGVPAEKADQMWFRDLYRCKKCGAEGIHTSWSMN